MPYSRPGVEADVVRVSWAQRPQSPPPLPLLHHLAARGAAVASDSMHGYAESACCLPEPVHQGQADGAGLPGPLGDWQEGGSSYESAGYAEDSWVHRGGSRLPADGETCASAGRVSRNQPPGRKQVAVPEAIQAEGPWGKDRPVPPQHGGGASRLAPGKWLPSFWMAVLRGSSLVQQHQQLLRTFSMGILSPPGPLSRSFQGNPCSPQPPAPRGSRCGLG